MFTVKQIEDAHAKVLTGADFPKYIAEIVQMGVTGFETFVADSHTVYSGADGFRAISEPQYDPLKIAPTGNKELFANYLKNHQLGNTDYVAFCKDCAETGVVRWIVDLGKMTCTYFDKAGNEMLTESIPG